MQRVVTEELMAFMTTEVADPAEQLDLLGKIYLIMAYFLSRGVTEELEVAVW